MITVYHNPRCSKSREALALVEGSPSGHDLQIIEYLKTPPTREQLVALLIAMEMSPRDLMRRKGTPYGELGLDDEILSDAQLLDAMLEHPILIERPIVVTEKGVLLCRPSERVLDLLENPDIGTFVKEDGEVVPPKADQAG